MVIVRKSNPTTIDIFLLFCSMASNRIKYVPLSKYVLAKKTDMLSSGTTHSMIKLKRPNEMIKITFGSLANLHKTAKDKLP